MPSSATLSVNDRTRGIGARAAGGDGRRDGAPSFLAALAMHAAMIGWMWFAVQWHTSASAPAVAELWELPPVLDASAPVVPAPAPAPEPAKEEPPPQPDIVVKREKPPRKDHKPKPAAREQSTEDLIRQQVAADTRHQDEMQRLTRQAGVPARMPAMQSTGPISNEYGARVQSAVRAHLSFAVPEGVASSVYAEFAVELLPTGEQASEPRLTKPSGLPGFDEAARRAILRTDPFPRRDDGTVPRSFILQLHPQDVR
jgi:colicin import membrane protein